MKKIENLFRILSKKIDSVLPQAITKESIVLYSGGTYRISKYLTGIELNDNGVYVDLPLNPKIGDKYRIVLSGALSGSKDRVMYLRSTDIGILHDKISYMSTKELKNNNLYTVRFDYIGYNNNGCWIVESDFPICKTYCINVPSFDGNGNPIISELYNDLGQITWTKDKSMVGYYRGTSVGAFPPGKTFMKISYSSSHDFGYAYSIQRQNDDEVVVQIKQVTIAGSAFVETNCVMRPNHQIRIEVY